MADGNPYNYKIIYLGSSKVIHRIVDKLNNVARAVLGTTHETAYYGDQGEAAWQHSLLQEGNPHHVTLADLGIEDLPRQVQAILHALGLTLSNWTFHGPNGQRINVIDHDGKELVFLTVKSPFD